jgi:hypothetical protein
VRRLPVSSAEYASKNEPQNTFVYNNKRKSLSLSTIERKTFRGVPTAQKQRQQKLNNNNFDTTSVQRAYRSNALKSVEIAERMTTTQYSTVGCAIEHQTQVGEWRAVARRAHSSSGGNGQTAAAAAARTRAAWQPWLCVECCVECKRASSAPPIRSRIERCAEASPR